MPKLLVNNINLNLFKEEICPETSYILGLLWADGSLYHNMTQLEIIEEDANEIKHLFLNTGLWNIKNRIRKHWKPQTRIHISNKQFTSYLYENDYKNKSVTSPDKILSTIPDNLKQYWFRGYWDGDGCFYFNNKNNFAQCTLTSAYSQNWLFMEYLFEKLNIGFNVRRVLNKHSYSCIRTTGRIQSSVLIKYLYNDRLDIGFRRKYNKAMTVLNSFNSTK